MAEEKNPKKFVFEYRHINHVRDPKPGETYEDFQREVIAKYDAIDNPGGIQIVVDEPKPGPVVEVDLEPPPPPTPIIENNKAIVPTPEPIPEPEPEYMETKGPVKYRVVKGNGVGWYNVVDVNGNLQSEKSIRKGEAEKLAEELNSGRDTS